MSGSRYFTVLAHGGQLDVIIFGNLDAVSLAQAHHDVEEIHAVQFHLLAEGDIVLERAQVLVGHNIVEDIQNLRRVSQQPS